MSSLSRIAIITVNLSVIAAVIGNAGTRQDLRKVDSLSVRFEEKGAAGVDEDNGCTGYLPVGAAAPTIDSRGALVAQTWRDWQSLINNDGAIAVNPVAAGHHGVHFAYTNRNGGATAEGIYNRWGYAGFNPLTGGFAVPGGSVVVQSGTEGGLYPRVMVDPAPAVPGFPLSAGAAILCGHDYQTSPDVGRMNTLAYPHLSFDSDFLAASFGGIMSGSFPTDSVCNSGNPLWIPPETDFDQQVFPKTAMQIRGSGVNDTVFYIFTRGTLYDENSRVSAKLYRKVGKSQPGWGSDWQLLFKDVQDHATQQVAVSPVSNKVAICWIRDSEVWYCVAPNGAPEEFNQTHWVNLTSGISEFPWCQCNVFIDTQDKVHILYQASEDSNSIIAKLYHWHEQTGLTSVVYDATWPLINVCGRFGSNVQNIGRTGIAECEGRLYVFFSTANDPNLGPQDDCCSSQTFTFAGNAEVYVTVSSDLFGEFWDVPRNLSNSYTPNCDSGGAAPYACADDQHVTVTPFGTDDAAYPGAELWTSAYTYDPSGGAYTGSEYLHVMYNTDRYPGLASSSQGPYTLNDQRWIRMACVPAVLQNYEAHLAALPQSIAYAASGNPQTFTVELSNTGNSSAYVTSVTPVFDSSSGPGAPYTDWISVSSLEYIPRGGSAHLSITCGDSTIQDTFALFGHVVVTYGPPSGSTLVIPVQYTYCSDCDATPVVTVVTPNTGGNVGEVAVTVFGYGFLDGAGLSLVSATGDTLVVDPFLVSVVAQDKISAVLDLESVPTGAYDLRVTNINDKEGVLSNGFEVELGRELLWADLSGRQVLRMGRPESYLVNFGNSGNVDAFNAGIIVKMIGGVPFSVSLPSEEVASSDTTQYDDGTIIVNIPFLPAGGTGSLKVRVSPNQIGVPFELSAGIIKTTEGIVEDFTSLADSSEMGLGPSDTPAFDEYSSQYNGDANTARVSLSSSPCQSSDRVDCSANPPAGYIMIWDFGDGGDYEFPSGARRTVKKKHIAKSLGDGQYTEFWMEPPIVGGQSYVTIRSTPTFNTINSSAYKGAFKPPISNDKLAAHQRDLKVKARQLVDRYSQNNGWQGGHCEHDRTADKLTTNCMGWVQLLDPELKRKHLVGFGAIESYLRDPGFLKGVLYSVFGEGVPKCPTNAPNPSTLRGSVGGSCDPNDKVGPLGHGENRFVTEHQNFTYTIHFENVATATLYSDSIWIVDTLSPQLDWNTIEFGEIFPGAGPDSIRPNYKEVHSFDPATGVIIWGLYDINLPPDTAVCLDPPACTQKEYWGEGWVSYSVRPKQGLATGTRIENIAAIKFDVNDWILAPMDSVPVFNTIDTGSPISHVQPLPDSGSAQFVVSWTGADDSAGSGVASYSVYFSTNGINFQPWILDTIGTKDTFNGQIGTTYYFRSIAKDNVGHIEPAKTGYETHMTVKTCCIGKRGNVNMTGITDLSDLSALVSYLTGGGFVISCADAANVNAAGIIDLADLSALVSYLTGGGYVLPNCP